MTLRDIVFHLLHGEMSINLDDVSSMPRLLIKRILLDHSRMTRPEELEIMVTYLRDDLEDALKELEETRWCHTRFAFLENLYTYHPIAAVEADGDDALVMHHITCALRSYPMYLIGTSIFVDKIFYYVDVVYLKYIIDFEHIHEYNRGSLVFCLRVLKVS